MYEILIVAFIVYLLGVVYYFKYAVDHWSLVETLKLALVPILLWPFVIVFWAIDKIVYVIKNSR